MGCVLKTSTLYKDMERIHGKEYSIDAYAMAYKIDDLMSRGLITTTKFVNLSNDRQIVYKVPKFEGIDKISGGYKKDFYLKRELEKYLAEKRLDTISVRETLNAILVTVRPDRVMTDAEYNAINKESVSKPVESPIISTTPIVFVEEDIEAEDTIKEKYSEPKYEANERVEIKENNKQELNKVGVQLKLFNDELSPEQSEIYLNFEKYYPNMAYLNDAERQDFVRLLSKGAIETKCKL